MRMSLGAAMLMLLSTSAIAEPMPLSLTMRCYQVAALVRSRGAVVLRTGPYTYDRYVSHAGFCVLGETTEPAWVPTLDTPQCFIGYRCVDADRDRDLWERWTSSDREC